MTLVYMWHEFYAYTSHDPPPPPPPPPRIQSHEPSHTSHDLQVHITWTFSRPSRTFWGKRSKVFFSLCIAVDERAPMIWKTVTKLLCSRAHCAIWIIFTIMVHLWRGSSGERTTLEIHSVIWLNRVITWQMLGASSRRFFLVHFCWRNSLDWNNYVSSKWLETNHFRWKCYSNVAT